MTDTTKTFWDVDGTSLQTYATNIATIGGDRMGVPEVRGDDEIIPFRPGEDFVPKERGAHVITLGMWVMGANPDGSIPTAEQPARKFWSNWRALRKLLFRYRTQFTLTKRFWIPEAELLEGGMNVDDLPREGIYRLVTASAKGSFAGGLVPLMNGTSHAAFTVNIKLTDPFFYSDPIEIPFSMATGGSNPGPDHEVYILGDDRNMAIGIDFTGPLTGPRIINDTYDVFARYNTAIASGKIARLDVWDFEARHDVDGDNTPASGHVQYEGDAFWLFLEPGENLLKLRAEGGTGTAKLTYQPGWF